MHAQTYAWHQSPSKHPVVCCLDVEWVQLWVCYQKSQVSNLYPIHANHLASYPGPCACNVEKGVVTHYQYSYLSREFECIW